MPHARLVLTLPAGVWVGDLTRERPDLRIRVLAAIPDGHCGVGRVEFRSPDVDEILSDLAAFDDLGAVDVLRRESDCALVQFETSRPLALRAACEAGVPLETPFVVRNGDAYWAVTAPHDDLSALGTALDSHGIDYRVEYLQHDVPDATAPLTDRQRRLVTAAVEAGYYDTPRTCSLTDLADRLDLAKSTASETLHRAEGVIVKEFVSSKTEAPTLAVSARQADPPEQ